jgi:hypothetical protein
LYLPLAASEGVTDLAQDEITMVASSNATNILIDKVCAKLK